MDHNWNEYGACKTYVVPPIPCGSVHALVVVHASIHLETGPRAYSWDRVGASATTQHMGRALSCGAQGLRVTDTLSGVSEMAPTYSIKFGDLHCTACSAASSSASCMPICHQSSKHNVQ